MSVRLADISSKTSKKCIFCVFRSFLSLCRPASQPYDKDFKKVGPICGNLSYKSQLTKVWAAVSWNWPKNFVCKIQNPGQITRPTIYLKMVLKRKLGKDFKKVGLICGNLSFMSNWCGNLKSNFYTLYKAVCASVACLCFAEPIYGQFSQSNIHRTLNFCPEQPERNQMYQSQRVAKILLSTLYAVLPNILQIFTG